MVFYFELDYPAFAQVYFIFISLVKESFGLQRSFDKYTHISQLNKALVYFISI